MHRCELIKRIVDGERLVYIVPGSSNVHLIDIDGHRVEKTCNVTHRS